MVLCGSQLFSMVLCGTQLFCMVLSSLVPSPPPQISVLRRLLWWRTGNKVSSKWFSVVLNVSC